MPPYSTHKDPPPSAITRMLGRRWYAALDRYCDSASRESPVLDAEIAFFRAERGEEVFCVRGTIWEP
jgi:hypothetical protein